MLYPTTEEWENWGIDNPVHRFFALHWTELFDTDTSESWQVRTCNIRTILVEIIETAISIPKRETNRHVVRALFDEGFSLLKRDSAVKRLFPFVLTYLEPWRKKEITEKDAPEVERVATIVLGNLEDYWSGIKSIVLGMLDAADGNKKYELYDATMTLALEAVARGHSPSYIRKLFLDMALVASQRPFRDRVSDVLDLLSIEKNAYTCVFLVRGMRQATHKRILPQDVILTVGPPRAVTPGDEQEFYSSGNNSTVYLSVTVESVDPEAARHAAEQRLTQVFATLNLYGVEDKFLIDPPTALVIKPNNEKQRVGPADSGVSYLNNAWSRITKSEALFRVYNRLSVEDQAQLMAALQYHRLALTSTSDEARFVNLWIGLESMCQEGSESLIERVTSRISPCVSLGKIRKTLISLSKYVRHLWTAADHARFLALFPNSRPEQLRAEDLLSVLLLEDNTPALTEFTNLILHHPLICNRLTKAHTKLLDSPNSIVHSLRNSKQNVEWQIKRIYRIRNEIVHKGRITPPIIRQLTQHLHTYFIRTVQAVVYELDRHPRWSISDALEHERRLFEHLVNFFETTDRDKISQATLLNPQNCLLTQQAPFAWRPTPAAALTPSAAAVAASAPAPPPVVPPH
jgi:Apea-like HEPN